jgi:hypothetical protein
MSPLLKPTVIVTIVAGCILAIRSRDAMRAADDAKTVDVRVSNYAPAADLANQLTAIAARLDDLLAKPEEFDDARKSRIAKEANVAAVVALALALSDEKHPLRDSASSALAAARTLATSEDYNKSKLALGQLKAVVDGKSPPTRATESVRWAPVAPLGLLMKEVPIVNSNLKRSVQGERFKSQAKVSAAAAATLAAIAQESAGDHSAVKNPADTPKWEQFCAEMRDAAGHVNRAIHAGDSDETASAMKQLSQTCDRCHKAFRK